MTPKNADLIRIGRIGRAHGLKGLVQVEVWTDVPDIRFAIGAELQGDDGKSWRVLSTTWRNDRLLVGFAGLTDRTAAEAANGVVLRVSADTEPVDLAPDEYFDRDLIGLGVRNLAGTNLGVVTDVIHLPSQDLLAVSQDDHEVLVPLVRDIVMEIDPNQSLLVVDPPHGLFGESE